MHRRLVQVVSGILLGAGLDIGSVIIRKKLVMLDGRVSY